MVSTSLVNTQIEDGEKIVRQLDTDEFAVDAALWFFDTQKEKWILYIASPLVGSIGPRKSYDKLRESLDRMENKLKTPALEISLIKPEHDILQTLKLVIKTGPEISRIRFTGNVINGIPIEDALIYRLG